MESRKSGNEVRSLFLKHMKKRGHEILPAASLIPENDPTTLFTGSGMQPLVPYLLGEEHPKGTRLANSQKCFRSDDILEVGDNRHTTFFEMLGNWSLGDYFKAEQLEGVYSFLTDDLALDPERIFVTVFIGNDSLGIERDDESANIWQGLFKKKNVSFGIAEMGSESDGGKRGMRDGERIFYYDESKNWWSRSGKPSQMPLGEIGGPDSEIFYDFRTVHNTAYGAFCHPNCDCGRFIEIGNSVFMQYVKTVNGFEKLPKQNVDFGGGLERITAACNNDPDVFKIDLLYPLIGKLESLSGKRYEENMLAFRIVADHIRGTVFMIADGVMPANTEQGYFTRRLIRRAVRYADSLGLKSDVLSLLAPFVIDIYKAYYDHLSQKSAFISNTIAQEEHLFRKTLTEGLKQFNKVALKVTIPSQETKDEYFTEKVELAGRTVYTPKDGTVRGVREIEARTAFDLFTTYGFPIELTLEIAKERGLTVDTNGFERLMEEHRERSRKGSVQKFKGGLADQSDKTVSYHTATHLLLAGLRNELGNEVHQAGSNITAERLRFDFTYPERVPGEVLKRVESYVNEAITRGAKVSIETISKREAEQDPTIEGSFWERYPDEVKVYTIRGDDGRIFSRELCGGPHVENTSILKGTFKILKEESSSQGVRRIKAVLE